MDIIRWSMNRPVSVAVGVLLVVLFGLIGVRSIPIQLTPTADPPIITVTTNWPGRSPEEIIDQITKEQEERLKNVRGLKSMRSISREGAAEITLEFYLDKDIQSALQDVSDSLRQVPEYPEDVDEPIIKASEGSSENAIAWIIIDLDPARAASHPTFDITTLFDPADQQIRPYLERIDGVAEVNVFGGREREVRVMVDPMLLAQRRLTYGDVIAALRRENSNISAGSVADGKRDYRVRVIGQFENEQDILDTVVAYREGRPVYVRDIGAAEISHQKLRGFVRTMGHPALAIRVLRQSGANVMTVMKDVRARLQEIRADMLPRLDPVAGPDLRIRQVYDETTYIDSAIQLVLGNLWIGGSLAAASLLLFLRSIKTTLIIALAIPISIIGTFLVMLAAGRTLNVISLAGLAFATGMVVDNAIVVLENIDRRRNLGDSVLIAVYRGAKEVWGAILAGTLTTVAVFIPILTIREEVGQLFFDLTLAMAVSVSLSLIVAITVVPSAAAVLLRLGVGRDDGRPRRHPLKDLFGLVPLMGRGTSAISAALYWIMTGWRGWTLRPALIVLMTVASIWGSLRLMPPLDYLPAGNRNLVFGGLLIPPGLSIDHQREYAERIEAKVGPYMWDNLRDDPKRLESLAPIPKFPFAPPNMAFRPVAVENFFIGAFNGGMFAGATSKEEQVVIPIGALLTSAMNGLPDAFGGARQASIFGMGIGGGNTVNVEISGPDLGRVTAAAGMIFGLAMGSGDYGPGSVQTSPNNFNLRQQELRLVLNRQGRELGLRTEDLGVAARGLVDGAFVGDFQLAGRNVDMVLLPTGGRLDHTQDILDVPVVTPSGETVPIRSVVDVVPSLAPQQILRIEELPAVSVQLRPPSNLPLARAMESIQSTLIAPARAAGVIDGTMQVKLEGTAAKLTDVQGALFGLADPSPKKRWQRFLEGFAFVLALVGLAGMLYGVLRAVRRGRRDFAYGAVGLLLLGIVVGGLLFAIADWPHLLTARFVWALLVTYLLMSALFESFLYPAVIMFSVPLATVGGFGALKWVHEWTSRIETIPPQQLDVLTMIGFFILIGTVVNNAILLVEQSLNFMKPGHGMPDGTEEPLPPLRAIAESVRTRIRPIFMTTLTTLGGGLPLVLAPGAGSEMYRGLGAVVVGGLFCSTIFTLLLVPLAFSLVLQMRDGARALLGRSGGPHPGRTARSGGAPPAHKPELQPA
jgi:HAE1 family hydrophobic/amphiphilic exporter-1